MLLQMAIFRVLLNPNLMVTGFRLLLLFSNRALTMSPKEGPRSKRGRPAAKADRRRGSAGNKHRVFAYRFFSTTSWVSQMISHPRFCFYPLSYSEAGWED